MTEDFSIETESRKPAVWIPPPIPIRNEAQLLFVLFLLLMSGIAIGLCLGYFVYE